MNDALDFVVGATPHVAYLPEGVYYSAQQLADAQVAAKGGQVLFVGSKKQAQEAVKESAKACGQPYVVGRWLGGTLTNFKTIKQGIDRLKSLEKMAEDGTFERLPKKEVAALAAK